MSCNWFTVFISFQFLCKMVCFDDENASAHMYISVLVTVRVQASQHPCQTEVTVL